jgi:alkyl hydroperoxide reductase subunit AhpC
MVANLKSEFEKRNVKILALSIDDVDSHQGWISDINETQNTTVNYPIVADSDSKVANLYGMIHPKSLNRLTVRSVFIIDPNKKVRLTSVTPFGNFCLASSVEIEGTTTQSLPSFQLAGVATW